MTKTATMTYEEALAYALPAFCEFYDTHDRLRQAYEDRRAELTPMRRAGMTPMVASHALRALEYASTRLAAVTCAEQDLIRYMFGVSEEQLHGDLMALRAERS